VSIESHREPPRIGLSSKIDGSLPTFVSKTLSNGTSGLTVNLPHASKFAIVVRLNKGSSCDPSGKEGTAHLLEHVLGEEFSDKRKFAAQQKKLYANLINDNADTGEEHTAYYASGPAENHGLILDHLSSVLFNSKITTTTVKKHKAIIKAEIAENYRDPGVKFTDINCRRFLLRAKGLTHSTFGNSHTIDSITARDLQEFYYENYRAENMTVAAVGKLPPNINQLLENTFGRWRNDIPLKNIFATERVHKECHRKYLCKWDPKASSISLSIHFPGLSYTDPDWYITQVLERIVCGSPLSLLNKILREDLWAVYSVTGENTAYSSLSLFSISAIATNLTSAKKILTSIKTVCQTLCDQSISKELLEIEKNRLGFEVFDSDKLIHLAYELAERYQMLGHLFTPNNFSSKIRTITTNDIRRVAKRIFDFDAMKITAYGCLGKNPRAMQNLFSR